MRRSALPSEIAEMALLMYRFLFLLTDTAEAMNAAQTARLGHSTYRRHMRSLSLLIANLMPRAFARARRPGGGARGARLARRAASIQPGAAGVRRPVSAPSSSVELLVLAFGLWTS